MTRNKMSSLIMYYLSYISVALIGCAAIGIAIFFLSVSELRSTAEQAESTQLQIAAQDLDTQLKVFETIRDEISSNSFYRTSYLNQNKYHEVELLHNFAQYNSYSVLCSDYFLFYRGTESVFAREAKYELDYYLSSIIRVTTEESELFNLTSALNLISDVTLLETGANKIMIIYPVRLDSAGTTQIAAVLCFVMDRSVWLERVSSVSGKLTGSLSIYYHGELLAGLKNTAIPQLPMEDGAIYSDKNWIVVSSPSGDFLLSEQIPPGGWYSGLSSFRIIILAMGAISVLLVLLTMYLIARKNHAPIRRLAAQVRDLLPRDGSADEASELRQIEFALQQTHQQNNLNQQLLADQMKLLTEQSDLLRQQVLLLVLNGNISDGVRRQLTTLQLSLDGAYYCVYLLHFGEAVKPDILKSIEKLSDEDATLYAFRIGEQQAAVIGCFAVEDLTDGIPKLIQEISYALNCDLTVQKGMVIDALEKMPASYYMAQFKPDTKQEENAGLPLQASGEWISCRYLAPLLDDIRSGNREAGLRHLQLLLTDIQTHYTSLMLQRSIVADILSELVRLSHELEVPIHPEETGAILVYQHSSAVCRDLSALVNRLFDRLDERRARLASDRALRIRQYIDQHALTYDISLQKLAEVFQLSTKQINHDIRSVTGMTYKGYVLDIRIRKATELLAQPSLSVVQISERIGYVDVSSFIKAFQSATGLTPAAYRRAQNAATT